MLDEDRLSSWSQSAAACSPTSSNTPRIRSIMLIRKKDMHEYRSCLLQHMPENLFATKRLISRSTRIAAQFCRRPVLYLSKIRPKRLIRNVQACYELLCDNSSQRASRRSYSKVKILRIAHRSLPSIYTYSKKIVLLHKTPAMVDIWP